MISPELQPLAGKINEYINYKLMLEINDNKTRQKFISWTSEEAKEAGFDIHRIQCDEELNTFELINQNGFAARVYVKKFDWEHWKYLNIEVGGNGHISINELEDVLDS